MSEIQYWHGSHLLDHVEHLFDRELPVLEDSSREIVEIHLALFVAVLLSALSARALLDDWAPSPQ